MGISDQSHEDQKTLEQVLGYLNFSSGAADPRFLRGWNRVFELAADDPAKPLWQAALNLLQTRLRALAGQSATFRDVTQAAAVLDLLATHVLPGYLEFHRDLLFHQAPPALLNSLFVGRVAEAVLRQGAPWEEHERIRRGAIAQLNDYVGHRPVATLESKERIEPYAHEWVRPVPLYIRDAGVAVGPYHEVVARTLTLLQATDEDILRDACFDPALLEELAFDPRAYDFDHPANKRPNYHFGQWDPHHIDNRGFYRRYVAQQTTLDALMSRLRSDDPWPREELLFEAAAVLVGTIIMATGISGAGPDAHDSTATLANLLPKIAAYRDAFYERLLARLEGAHGQRLREEAAKRRQPFGGARQHLNQELARRRAAQLEHVHLAAVFARMGYTTAATQHASFVPAASARMLCHIDCRLTECERAVVAGDLQPAAALVEEIMDWIKRGIECGAIVDPWNILGFDGNFSLFPALENTVRDYRVDELVALMDQVFGSYSRIWSEAAAKNQQDVCRHIAERFRAVTAWWRKYAAHEVSSVEATDAADAYRAAELVAKALNLWQQGGAAAEDVRFWAPHADLFDSPKAYALVVRALLERDDFVSSMALLVHWLSRADQLGLEKTDTSFAELAERWMLQLRHRVWQGGTPEQRLHASKLSCKFLDYLEANAEDYWQPPRFELGTSGRARPHDALPEGKLLDRDEETEEDDELQEGIFEAAYEGVVYRDSTDDGIDSELMDTGQPSDDELQAEAKRLRERLSFLSTVARLWQLAVAMLPPPEREHARRQGVLQHWLNQALENRGRLKELLDEVNRHPLPTPSGDHDSMVEYDRVRLIRESILEQVIATSLDTVDAARLLAAAAGAAEAIFSPEEYLDDVGEDERFALCVLAAVLRGDPAGVRAHWDALIESLLGLPLLYVPLAKGGNPHQIIAAKSRQRTLQDLLAWLPRMGLIRETCRLIETAREMERLNPVGPGAVTEFDELFKVGYKALVRLVVESAADWRSGRGRTAAAHEEALVECLKHLTESLLSSWLAHSKTLRLSVLEKVRDKRTWNDLVTFIQSYGAELFTQRFLNLANLRAILHQGVGRWLGQLATEVREQLDWRLLDDLERGQLAREEATEHLSLILEAIIENYGEYRDYNSMTTQSDRGELLYTLLDFLRLRTQYDRICWQLKPVVWAHEILVRGDFREAAQLWRRELTEQTHQQATAFLDKLTKLQTQYAMRMPTVADRLNEKFVRPMAIDRIRALVKPAMAECQRSGPSPNYELFQHETDLLMKEPTGVGLDVPAWLEAIEEEVERVSEPDFERDLASELESLVPQQTLSLEHIQQQLEKWAARR
jgi:hypothetical protein